MKGSSDLDEPGNKSPIVADKAKVTVGFLHSAGGQDVPDGCEQMRVRLDPLPRHKVAQEGHLGAPQGALGLLEIEPGFPDTLKHLSKAAEVAGLIPGEDVVSQADLPVEA